MKQKRRQRTRSRHIKAKAGINRGTSDDYEPSCKNCARYATEDCSDPFSEMTCDDYKYNGHGNITNQGIVKPNRTRGAY